MNTLIPRSVLFGNPERTQARLSPDGKKISFLAPSPQGIMNVWIQTLGEKNPTMLTHDTHRGITTHAWIPNGKSVLFIQDVGGDENWHVYTADLETKKTTNLTPYPGIRAEGLMLSRIKKDELLVGLNLKDPVLFDMYRINVVTGNLELDTANPGDVMSWLADAQFEIRAAMSTNIADGSMTLRIRDNKEAPWRDLLNWPFGESGHPVTFSKDGKTIFLTTSIGADTSRLVEVDLSSGQELRELARDPQADLAEIMHNPDHFNIEAVEHFYLKPSWAPIEAAVAQDFAFLGQHCKGAISIQSRSHADDLWIVSELLDDGPTIYWLYYRQERKLERLFVDRPELEKYKLAPMEALVIPARDGLPMVCYMTRPTQASETKPPLILNVHGGPWARDYWGFDPEAQWLANRGFTVLQVNYRSSTGFGKNFLNAGNGQWGQGKMQDDLTDVVRWAIDQGIADPKKVAIYGGSYGGYATLAGLTFTPDLYVCGIDIVGPSNLKTLFETIPPYWKPFKTQMVLRVGDVENDEELNRHISPLFHVEKIQAPLFIAQGKNDPRVKIQESDQIVTAMRQKNLMVQYVVYTDEGHGFVRPENRMDFYGRAEEFLTKCLGVSCEPWQEMPGSSAEEC